MSQEKVVRSAVDTILRIPAERVHEFAAEMSQQTKVSPETLQLLSQGLLQELQTVESIESQSKLLTMLFLVEADVKLYEGTDGYLAKLAAIHNFKGEFSDPFKRFISKRLKIAENGIRRLKIGSPADAQEIFRLLEENSRFFFDILELQNYFSEKVSPVLALNSTWNPLCTQRFGLKGIKGLKYVYSNNENSEYRRLMKQQMSSEWTGFNRFSEEPWAILSQYIKKEGNLLDIGSCIGISALEIANTLEMNGSIILVDSDSALRMADTARVIDYNNAEGRFISLRDAQERMDILRQQRLVVSLLGLDFSQPLDNHTRRYTKDSALTHCANMLVYLQAPQMFQTLLNCLEVTDPAGGVVKLHNDPNLEFDPAMYSLSLQRNAGTLTLLAQIENHG